MIFTDSSFSTSYKTFFFFFPYLSPTLSLSLFLSMCPLDLRSLSLSLSMCPLDLRSLALSPPPPQYFLSTKSHSHTSSRRYGLHLPFQTTILLPFSYLLHSFHSPPQKEKKIQKCPHSEFLRTHISFASHQEVLSYPAKKMKKEKKKKEVLHSSRRENFQVLQ